VSKLRYTICDVFADRPSTGNALAVFGDAAGLDESTMQALGPPDEPLRNLIVVCPRGATWLK
jgi:hypothetical protein